MDVSGNTLLEAGYSDWGSGSPSSKTDQCGALSQHAGAPRGVFQLKNIPCNSDKLFFMCEQNIIKLKENPSALEACTGCGKYGIMKHIILHILLCNILNIKLVLLTLIRMLSDHKLSCNEVFGDIC